MNKQGTNPTAADLGQALCWIDRKIKQGMDYADAQFAVSSATGIHYVTLQAAYDARDIENERARSVLQSVLGAGWKVQS
jgi:hypothetical protein